MKTIEVDVPEFEVSKRWIISRGSTIRLGRGGQPPIKAGTYRVVRIYRKGPSRFFLDVWGDRGLVTVFIAGRPYRSKTTGTMSRPHKVRRPGKRLRKATR